MKNQSKPNTLKILLYFISGVFVLLSFLNFYFYNRILPGVYIGDSSISYLTKDAFLKKYEPLSNNNQLKVSLSNGENFEISLPQIGFYYNLEDTYKKAFYVGRETFISPYAQYLNFLLGKRTPLNLIYTYDENVLNVLVASTSAKYYPEIGNASFYLDDKGVLRIKDASFGKKLNAKDFKKEVLLALSKGNTELNVQIKDFTPSFYASDLAGVKNDVEAIISKKVFIEFNGKKEPLTKQDILKVLDFSKTKQGDIQIVLNSTALKNLAIKLSENYEVTPRGTVLKVNGDTIDFTPPVKGISVRTSELEANLKSTLEKLLQSSNLEEEFVILIPYDEVNPPVSQNDYGITELIAEGVSYFKGSDYNRVRNIITASSKIKGTLVAPGETFSFNKAVGPITLESGFNQAYVISKGRTTLGTGGGVCQVSTTVYRAALNAGLPIVKRTSHSYRVSYYEQQAPLGLDATIYQPSVDLVFKNDTKNYILVYTELDEKESKLSVKIYGTKDGRTVTITEPKYEKPIPPPPARYIDDPSLPKGKLIQVEYPAWGGLVTYTRIVKDKDGNIMYKDDFKNYYTPWAAVYKRGTKE